MKRLKLRTVLANAALALLAFAVPASASAAEWLKNGVPLEEAETISINGWMQRDLYVPAPPYGTQFEHLGCPYSAEVELVPGSDEAWVTNYGVESQMCEGSGGPRTSGCRVQSVETSMPWFAHVSGMPSEPSITIDEAFFEWKVSDCVGGSDSKLFSVNGGEVDLNLDNPAEIGSFELSVPRDPESTYYEVWPYDWTGAANEWVQNTVSPAGVFGISQ